MPRKRSREALRIEKDYKSKKRKIDSQVSSARGGQTGRTYVIDKGRAMGSTTGVQQPDPGVAERKRKYAQKPVGRGKSGLSSTIAFSPKPKPATPHVADAGKPGTKPKSPHAGLVEKTDNKGDKKKPLTKAQIARNKARAKAKGNRKKPKSRRAGRKNETGGFFEFGSKK